MKIINSLKSFFFKPSAKFGLGVLLVLGAMIGVIAWIVFNTVLDETSKEEFCVSCHSMQQPLSELKETAHWSNKMGVAAECADCHLPHGKLDKYIRKIEAIKEIFAEASGKIDTKEKFEEHRLEMAEREWARMSANGSQECKGCHSYDRMKFDEMSPAARQAMIPAAKTDQSCIDCHKGIAHHLPKMTKEVSSVETLTEGKQYYLKAKTDIFLDEALTDNIGYIETAVPLTFIKSNDKGDLVELVAWRKGRGLSRILSHAAGKNISEAVLTKEFVKTKPKFEVIETVSDEMTGLDWKHIKLQVWIAKSQLVEDVAPIWANMESIYKTQCSTCHKQPDIAHFDSNAWIGQFKGMIGFTSMDEQTGKEVLRYLQLHSSDFKQH
ncbi:trimethylamine-N-oxide reductase cytochrome c-type subunit TorC [Bisgaardia hudsonensis]|uniref:Cytochrome c-type protein n=1 Tax=Bisgaardia hudsonensis TaxID=109472 RepID=A0A4R2MX44_9PAST|nr:pentaheme c-type cytochrome TorC [Bisgaardia hudsonensis]QLB12116.1 nitrate reductase [Bisgaardia hudsonensis]TCP11474.1 trimethylamine-N-oxide reductase cytochrome c-type subunit TorC [Bisgaardia hudsonensis]